MDRKALGCAYREARRRMGVYCVRADLELLETMWCERLLANGGADHGSRALEEGS